ncbi:PREDICTED: fibroblast growth factor 5-like, partial [Chaetura pelagica]|uniref:fibroblast growth factor 5-like n=1 Tax=Chaetura pelagica TaxID=8897 RepID=UPI0005231F47
AQFTADCQFRERFQENSYNTYSSAVHRSPRSGRPWYVALNKRGKAKRGCSPRPVLPESEEFEESKESPKSSSFTQAP